MPTVGEHANSECLIVYSLVVAPQVNETLALMLVEMKRTRGDPVLFVKPDGHGYGQQGALPSMLPNDLASYADIQSWSDKLDYHHITMANVLPGRSVFLCFAFCLLLLHINLQQLPVA